ncbi:hypothetical protein ABT072_45430 [Streptomyces sp. NPDC002589]|uniref:hypothetical protein n=1 Tax=Streptomyces sp. NPDC002589 TaxID=3154420 RepID=UPI003322B967
MDAGFAAVLGAAVGALGTGSAAIGAAVLARSQARAQLAAEHARIIREPRKAAYAAFAEKVLADHNRLTTAMNYLVINFRPARAAVREAALTSARQCYESHVADSELLGHRYAQVVVEGPLRVTSTAAASSAALAAFQGEIYQCLTELEDAGHSGDDREASMEERRTESHQAYLEFIHAASRAIAADGVNTMPE